MKTKTEEQVSRPVEGASGPVVLAPIPPSPVLDPVKRRRPLGLILAAVVLTLSGAIGAYYLTTAANDRAEVVGVAAEVEWGEVISAQDLVMVQIVPDANLRAVPWSSRTSLIGKRAAMTLVPGSLVTAAAASDDPLVPAGQAIVGVTLKAAQMPREALSPQDRIRLVITPESTNSTDPTAAVNAVVLSSTGSDTSGSRTVDVLVDQSTADELALAASAGRVTIIIVPKG